MTNDKLKPCLYCGSDKNVHEFKWDGVTCKECLGFWVDKLPTIEQWQNAWCWKEIDRLKQVLEDVSFASDLASDRIKEALKGGE